MSAERKRRKLMREVEKFEARQFREAGMSVSDCARYFDVSIATLMRGLADMREKLGAEKLPPRLAGRQRHSVRRGIENSSHIGS